MSEFKKNRGMKMMSFSDENGNHIISLPTHLALLLKNELRYVVQGLARQQTHDKEAIRSFTSLTVGSKRSTLLVGASTPSAVILTTLKDDHVKELALARTAETRTTARSTTALLQRMRQGRQTVHDFEDTVALWGYCRRKFSIRAMIAFETLHAAYMLQPHLFGFGQKGRTINSVMSLGGGPGNDLFGYLLFQKYILQNEATTKSTHVVTSSVTSHYDSLEQPMYAVMDFASGWEPIVAHLSALIGHEIRFCRGDLTQSLQIQPSLLNNDMMVIGAATITEKRTTAASAPLSKQKKQQCRRLFLVVYVLTEIMVGSSRSRSGGGCSHYGPIPALLQDLLDENTSSIFIFREPPNSNVLQHMIRTQKWKEGHDFWHLSRGGLLVLTREKQRYSTIQRMNRVDG